MMFFRFIERFLLSCQILLEGSRTNLELKSHGGITLLMLAVKMGNNRVLQQLIAKNVEITATDNEGMYIYHLHNATTIHRYSVAHCCVRRYF